MAHRICLATQPDLRDSVQSCTEIEGISIDATPQVLGVAHIDNEACADVVIGTDAKSTFILPSDGYQDLLAYLARPRLVFSGALPIARGSVFNVELSRNNLISLFFPNLATRLAGVYGIRFTTRFTIMTASTPFQQCYLASSFQYGTSSTNTVVYNRFNNSAMVTNLPHVIHDIAENTMSQLDIPFLYPYDFLPIYVGNNTDSLTAGATGGTIGMFSLNAIMPYKALAGSNAPTYKVLISLHDVELIGSYPLTATTVITQSGLTQSKKSKANNPMIKEAKAVKGSDIASKAAAVIRTVSPYVPMLGSIGAITANLLDVGSNVARAFGYSRPQVTEAPSRVFRNNHAGDANTDMDSNSFVLAPFQSNRLAVDALAGGTEVDESSIAYVIGKYGQIFIGNIATTDAVGTPLYATNVCPTNFWFRINAGRPGGNLPLPAGNVAGANSIVLSPLAYTSQFFRYWRGTMTFRFTFCKTKFHAGRVIAGFVPMFNDDVGNSVLTTTVQSIEITGGLPQPFSYCQVFDLKDSSSFELEVPYVSPVPFASILSSIGGVTLTVLDPLVATGETASAVDFLVEVKAEEDFQFGCPAPPMFAVSTPAPNSAAVTFYQSGLGGVQDIDDSVTQYTTGESILSFKTLAMIPSWFTVDITALTITSTSLWPFYWFGRFTMATPLPPTTNASFAFTRSGAIAAMYAFVTGGTEHHSYLMSPETNGLSMNVSQAAPNEALAASSLGDPRTRSITGAQRIFTNNVTLHTRVPSYQQYARIPVHAGNVYNNYVYGIQRDISPVSGNNAVLSVNNATPNNVRLVMGRAAADDARFMTYVGPPPVSLLQSTQTTYPDNTGVAALSTI